jgi:hypothetical protein
MEKRMPKDDDKQLLTLKVGTPKGSFTADFPKTEHISGIITAAISTKQLGGAPGDFEVWKGETALDLNRTLVSYHLADGDTLLVTAQGSGV